MKYPKNLDGFRFGFLTVTNLESIDRHGHIRYECLCDCGRKANIDRGSLLKGATRSCGCLRAIKKTARPCYLTAARSATRT